MAHDEAAAPEGAAARIRPYGVVGAGAGLDPLLSLQAASTASSPNTITKFRLIGNSLSCQFTDRRNAGNRDSPTIRANLGLTESGAKSSPTKGSPAPARKGQAPPS